MNIRPYIMPEQYLSADVARNTIYKSVANAYERNLFSVIRRGNMFCVEGYGCSDRTYNLVIKETKRLFPELDYLHDMKN